MSRAKTTRTSRSDMDYLFNKIEDYLPGIIVFLLWLMMIPIRVVVLLLIPPGSRYRWHRLHRVYEFFRFERKS